MSTESNRKLVVMDRGWVFVGDVEVAAGQWVLKRAMNVRRWVNIGLSGVANGDGRSSDVITERMDQPVTVPEGVVLFSIPVCDNWGL